MPARQFSTRSRPARRTLVAAATAGGLAALARATLAQRRHLRTIAADPDFRRLSAPLGGQPLPEVVSADGTRLHAEQFPPAGQPETPATVVLAHGWTEQLSFWGPVIERLNGAGIRVVAYDLRGHGDSQPAADDDYTLARFGEDLEAVLIASGSPAHRTAVAGHSLGAMSIVAWADAHPVRERVAAAALINTGLDDLIGGALLFGELAGRLNPPWVGRALLGSARPLLPVSTPISQAAVRYTAFGPDATPGMIAFYERMLLDTEPRARAAIGIALSTLDLAATLPQIDVPTLVIAGDRDRLTPPAHARRIAAGLPEPAGLIVLPQTGHMSPLERPDAVAEALLSLLGEAGLAPRSAAGR